MFGHAKHLAEIALNSKVSTTLGSGPINRISMALWM